MTYFLDCRADSVGGIPAQEVTVRRDWDAIDPQLLENETRGREVILVSHGFNVNRQQGIDALSWWERRLQLGNSFLFVGILWAGDSAWIPAIDYPLEGNEAIVTGKLLGRYLSGHLMQAATLSFASHSLGARVVLETIRQLYRPTDPQVRSLTLMAGAIDDDCLTGEYNDASAKVGNISLLASEGDKVLEWAFPAGNFFSGIITRGDPYWHAALGRNGPDTPFPSNLQKLWQIPNNWNYDHGDYFGTAAPMGPLINPPIYIPAQGTPPPSTPNDWKPAWSAGFAATRLAT